MLQADFLDEIRDAAEELGSRLFRSRDPVNGALCSVGAAGYADFAMAVEVGKATQAIEALSQLRTVAVLVLAAVHEGGIDRPKVSAAATRASLLATDAINLLYAQLALTPETSSEEAGFCGGINGLNTSPERWGGAGARTRE